MLRKIIKIDEALCNGCGACAQACHEGAIAMVAGKARLLRDDYCDGLGDCLPACPTGAISFEEREALAYDHAAVQAHMAQRAKGSLPCGCPGSQVRRIEREEGAACPGVPSQLRQWPVQIKLAPVNAPYFADAQLLIAADCTAYAYGNFHSELMRGRVVLIGCPKLDMEDYSQKLTRILAENDVAGVTVARMEVPCCGGIEHAAREALRRSGKDVPFKVVTISTDGRIL